MNPTTDVKFYGSQQHSSFYHECIISLHLPTANDHVIAKATISVSRGGESYRFLNQVGHRRQKCKEKRLWCLKEWVCCGSALWLLHLMNKQCSDKEDGSFGHDIFPTWWGGKPLTLIFYFWKMSQRSALRQVVIKCQLNIRLRILAPPMLKQFYMVLKIFWNCILGSNHKKRQIFKITHIDPELPLI